MPTTAVILAGGSGLRAGFGIPKQFALIRDIPIIAYTINAFNNHPEIDEIIIVSRSEDITHLRAVCDTYLFKKIKNIIPGGSTRQESSYNGIFECSGTDESIVLIHDAARPVISPALISRCIQKATEYGAALAAVPPSDTILKSAEGMILEFLNRSELLCAQTPQSFKLGIIRNAHKKAKDERFLSATDDTSLVIRLGLPCAVVQGEPENIKVTLPGDFILAEKLLENITILKN
jgi:2-C-methyl-D-erythritol 4-phosphate cytidylyltransferase